jgi:hypothetical protein
MEGFCIFQKNQILEQFYQHTDLQYLQYNLPDMSLTMFEFP